MVGYPGQRDPLWDQTRFWDRDGKPLRLLHWGWLLDQRTYRQVACGFVASASDLTRTYCVTTVWYGTADTLWHLWRDGVIPPLFRTAVLRSKVFDPTRDPGGHEFTLVEEDHAAREADARTLHDETMRRVTAWVDEPIVSHQSIVPARPRAGWAVERATVETLAERLGVDAKLLTVLGRLSLPEDGEKR